jgi:hypothetical protein
MLCLGSYVSGVIYSVMSWLVMSWLCLGYVLVMYWLCIGYVLVMSWLCIGYVLVMYWLCIGYVLDVVAWMPYLMYVTVDGNRREGGRWMWSELKNTYKLHHLM